MKNRVVLFIRLISLCCITWSSVHAAEDIVFRTMVSPEEPWVGQQVLLSVDVLAKDGWAQLKKTGNFELDGAYVMRLETQGTRLNEVIDGDSYTGQRYDIMLFPQRAGKFAILPVTVDVEVRSWGAGQGDQVHRLSLPLIEFAARTPPGAQGIRGLISTSALTARQTWDPQIDSATVGDAIKRVITLHAEDVSGMAFTPLRHADIANVGIYPGEPTVEDRFNRGDLSGTRVDTVTYIFEQPGDIEIPGIVLSWWDVGDSELKNIVVPGLSLHVVAGSVIESTAASDVTQPTDIRFRWGALIALVLAVLATFRFSGIAMGRLTAWRKMRSETEAMYFKHLLRSSRSGSRKAVMRDTMRWLDRINVDPRPARLDQFLEQYGDSDVQQAAVDLMNTLPADQDPSTISVFARGLIAARKRWHKTQRIRQQATIQLPELNSGA